jgi:insertion element IS1 protein InsB
MLRGLLDMRIFGMHPSGSQTYFCKTCKKYSILKSIKKTAKVDKACLENCFVERNSFRSIARIFSISAGTVSNWFKQSARNLPSMDSTIIPLSPEQKETIEADEVWTYVRYKENIIRIWIAIGRNNKQILSFFIGDGTMESCKRFWRKLPTEYLKQKSFSDFWNSYNCIPTDTHSKVGKETGETAHIERLNNTIRQTFSRMVRKTLSYSKVVSMLSLHFKYWAFHYNENIKNKFSTS